MKTQAVSLPYGKSRMTWTLPSGWRVDTAEPDPAPDPPDLETLVARALETPLGSGPLSSLGRPGMRVTLVVPDLTRPCPTPVLLGPLMKELERGGVSVEDVTVLLALGMHRQLEEEEIQKVLGPAMDRVRVLQAQGSHDSDYKDLGILTTLEDGRVLPAPVPLRLHPAVLDTDLLLSVGVVEPHQVAGYSGGGKAIGIGAAGSTTIGSLHGMAFLNHPGTGLGILEGNLFREAVEAIAGRARLRFVLQVAVDWRGRGVAAAAGEPRRVLGTLAGAGTPWTSVPSAPYDLVLAGVGPGKDDNLYQASRALTYLAFSPDPVMRPGGWVALIARCTEGGGGGPGEREFVERLTEGETPDRVVAGLRKSGYRGGGQRAFLVAKALSRYRGMIVGSLAPGSLRGTHFTLAGDPTEALKHLGWSEDSPVRVLAVPNALAILPRPAGKDHPLPRAKS